MKDKVQKIREVIEKRYEYWKEKESNSHSIESEIRMSECQYLILMLDSLQKEPVSKQKLSNSFNIGKDCKEEPVSEDLREASYRFACKCHPLKTEYSTTSPNPEVIESFKEGAKWQKENLWKPADGDDLPEYDREVIAIHDYVFGHYMVAYVHRPNPNGWNGTNIDTGEKEHFEPKIYDKGGWNQPHVLYWLDARLPYEENKIDKEIET